MMAHSKDAAISRRQRPLSTIAKATDRFARLLPIGAIGIALCLSAGFTGPILQASAGEIRGLVTDVMGSTITIVSRANERPKPGDEVEVFVVLPDLDGVAVVATGRVTRSDGNTVTAEISRTSAKVKPDQFARIRSAVLTQAPGGNATPLNPASSDAATDLEPLVPVPGEAALPLPGQEALPPQESPPPQQGLPTSDFKATVNRLQSALFLAGDPTKGSGTAFVISRKQRLLATNAHVADITDRVILNKSRIVYKVTKKWYHPGVIRVMDDGKTRVYSANPGDGTIDAHCPDLAILELERAGPDLPAEISLAVADELTQIQGSELGVLGFPGYQHDQNIAKRDLFASATFIKGTVSRMTGFDHEAEAAPDQQQMVHFSAPLYPGFSGSPVFLGNGRVAVIANHLHREAEQLGYGVRSDALWELIDHAGLRQYIPGAPEQLTHATNYAPHADARVESLREAMQLVREAADLKHHHDFHEAEERLEDAVEVRPDYWKIYWMRAIISDHFVKFPEHPLSRDARLKLHRQSLADHLRAAQLYSDGHNKPNPRLVLDVAREYINIGRCTGTRSNFQTALELLNDPSVQKGMGTNLSYFLALRGSLKMDLNDRAGALEDLNAAIRIDPDRTDFYTARAAVWQMFGEATAAARDKRRAAELHEKEHANHEHIPTNKASHAQHHGHKH